MQTEANIRNFISPEPLNFENMVAIFEIPVLNSKILFEVGSNFRKLAFGISKISYI